MLLIHKRLSLEFEPRAGINQYRSDNNPVCKSSSSSSPALRPECVSPWRGGEQYMYKEHCYCLVTHLNLPAPMAERSEA